MDKSDGPKARKDKAGCVKFGRRCFQEVEGATDSRRCTQMEANNEDGASQRKECVWVFGCSNDELEERRENLPRDNHAKKAQQRNLLCFV